MPVGAKLSIENLNKILLYKAALLNIKEKDLVNILTLFVINVTTLNNILIKIVELK